MNMTFDPTAVEPSTGRVEPFPEGRYVLQVIDSDVTPNSKETGDVLKLTLEVYDGPLKGRAMFENINLTNASPQAQEIGQKQLSALCHAAGITVTISDSQDLHYKPFEADVGIEPERTAPDGKVYGPKNRITKYHFGEPSAAAAKPVVARPAPAPAATGSRPWKRTA